MNIFPDSTNKTLINIGLFFIIASFIYSILKTSFSHALINSLIWWVIFWIIIKATTKTNNNNNNNNKEEIKTVQTEKEEETSPKHSSSGLSKAFARVFLFIGLFLTLSSVSSVFLYSGYRFDSKEEKNNPIVCQLQDINTYTNQNIYDMYTRNPFRAKEEIDGNCIKMTSKVSQISESGTFIAFKDEIDSVRVESFCMKMNTQDTLQLNIGDEVSFYGQAGTLEKESDNLISIPFWNGCKLDNLIKS